MATLPAALEQAAVAAADHLKNRQQRVVFAESCTAGLVSATLAQVAGISSFHCGSAVTYRNDTKHCWLGILESTLERETAVSDMVAQQMAQGVLAKTPEADVALSITGHLGPGAPDGFDGLVFIGAAQRVDERVQLKSTLRLMLESETRVERQQEAAAAVLARINELGLFD